MTKVSLSLLNAVLPVDANGQTVLAADVESVETPRGIELHTGGLSYGGVPAEAFDAVALLADLGAFAAPFSRAPGEQPEVLDSLTPEEKEDSWQTLLELAGIEDMDLAQMPGSIRINQDRVVSDFAQVLRHHRWLMHYLQHQDKQPET